MRVLPLRDARGHAGRVPPTVAESLRAAAQLGPFFTVDVAPDKSQQRHSLTELPTPAGQAVLAHQLTVTAAMLGTGDVVSAERRTVASILHLGAAAALCSPLLAVAALDGYVPQLTPESLEFDYPARGPLRLALRRNVQQPPAKPALLPQLADQLIDVALDGLLQPFTAAITEAEPLPEPTLAGNVFSSLAAAARLIEPAAAGQRARALIALMSRRAPLLQGAGDLHWQQPGGGHDYFRRRNCCLFYRIPGAGTCGDCILD